MDLSIQRNAEGKYIARHNTNTGINNGKIRCLLALRERLLYPTGPYLMNGGIIPSRERVWYKATHYAEHDLTTNQ